jgi:hypothetical protein
MGEPQCQPELHAEEKKILVATGKRTSVVQPVV